MIAPQPQPITRLSSFQQLYRDLLRKTREDLDDEDEVGDEDNEDEVGYRINDASDEEE